MKLDSEHNKKHGFKLPENYFKSFDDKLMQRLSGNDLDQNITSGFKAPEDYFDSVEESILSQVEPQPKVIKFKPNPNLYYIAGIAASLILLLAIFLNKNASDEISSEMVEAYFENRNLNSYDLAELLYDAELIDEDFVISENNLNEDQIESYLLEYSDIEQLLQ